MDLGDALAWLDRHASLGAVRGSQAADGGGRMSTLLHVLGNPEMSMPVVVVAGRHGKTATVRALAALLGSKGLSVGTVTSPHLSLVNERMAVDGEPISDTDLAVVVSDLAGLEPLLGEAVPSRAELLVAGGLRWFSDRPVDVAVLEAGGEGSDPTAGVPAVVEVTTATVTASMAAAGPVSTVSFVGPDTGEGSAGERWVAGADFGCSRNRLAVGGRSLDLWTPGGRYEGVWLGVRGSHQGDNFAAALAAGEAFFAAPIEERLVREAAGRLGLPGQLEVVGHRPTVVLDAATDPVEAACAARAVDEELTACRSRILVLGARERADPAEMLAALAADRAALVVACAPGEPGTLDAGVVADAARRLGVEALERDTVVEGLRAALDAAGPDDLVLVVGPPAMLGAARSALGAGR